MLRKVLRALSPDTHCSTCEKYFNCRLRKSIFNKNQLICEKYVYDIEMKGVKLEASILRRKREEKKQKAKESWMEGA